MEKHHASDHDTLPKEGKEKKAKSCKGKTTSDTNDNDKDELAYCYRCTEQVDQLIIQCERCEMWLCSNCEKVPDEAISLIGKFCEFRVHWYCKFVTNQLFRPYVAIATWLTHLEKT